MNSPGSQVIFDAVSTAATSGTQLTDNQRVVLVQVSVGAGVPISQTLKVYGSIGVKGREGIVVDPTLAASPTNAYSPLALKDLNDLNTIVGSDGFPIVANSVNTFEVNVNAIRDMHFVLTGSGAPVSVVMRSYRIDY